MYTTIHCPTCGKRLFDAVNPPVRGKCQRCHEIHVWDGTDKPQSARSLEHSERAALYSEYTARKRAEADAGLI